MLFYMKLSQVLRMQLESKRAPLPCRRLRTLDELIALEAQLRREPAPNRCKVLSKIVS